MKFASSRWTAPEPLFAKSINSFGQVAIAYRDVSGGAELTYRTKSAKLLGALHRWFDAQLTDHGAAAMEGHQHQHGDMPMK